MSDGPRQDWAPVTITRGRRSGHGHHAPKTRGGGLVATERKYASGENKSAHSAAGRDMRKVEEEDENFSLKKTGRELAMAIMKARTEKGWKQKDLAHRINEKSTVVNQYEQGKAIPNHQIISRMERALGVKLPRPGKKKKGKGKGKGGKK